MISFDLGYFSINYDRWTTTSSGTYVFLLTCMSFKQDLDHDGTVVKCATLVLGGNKDHILLQCFVVS